MPRIAAIRQGRASGGRPAAPPRLTARGREAASDELDVQVGVLDRPAHSVSGAIRRPGDDSRSEERLSSSMSLKLPPDTIIGTPRWPTPSRPAGAGRTSASRSLSEARPSLTRIRRRRVSSGDVSAADARHCKPRGAIAIVSRLKPAMMVCSGNGGLAANALAPGNRHPRRRWRRTRPRGQAPCPPPSRRRAMTAATPLALSTAPLKIGRRRLRACTSRDDRQCAIRTTAPAVATSCRARGSTTLSSGESGRGYTSAR